MISLTKYLKKKSNMYKIIINSIYRYENNEIEKFAKDYVAKLDNNVYIGDEIDLEFEKDGLCVTSKKNIYYIKKFKLNKVLKSRLEVNNSILETKIKTIKFKENAGTYSILASEYSLDNHKISDVKINIKIKEI